MRRLVFGLLVLAAGSAQAAQTPPLQSQAQWEAAVRNETTNPSYVLVSIVNDHTKDKQTGCTLADFVKGALFHEMGLASNPASFEKVRQRMIASKDHVFHFSDMVSLSNVTFHYTPADLARARAAVADYQAAIQSGHPGKISDELMHSDALACALVEQGYQVTNQDQTGLIMWKR
jgi:hypothetical protein